MFHMIKKFMLEANLEHTVCYNPRARKISKQALRYIARTDSNTCSTYKTSGKTVAGATHIQWCLKRVVLKLPASSFDLDLGRDFEIRRTDAKFLHVPHSTAEICKRVGN